MNKHLDIESLWHDFWPQNECRSQWWPIFHGSVILSDILKTIWGIVWIMSHVWCKRWPIDKFRSQWPIFHFPVILSYSLKTIWWMNVIILDNGVLSNLLERSMMTCSDNDKLGLNFCNKTWRLIRPLTMTLTYRHHLFVDKFYVEKNITC